MDCNLYSNYVDLVPYIGEINQQITSCQLAWTSWGVLDVDLFGRSSSIKTQVKIGTKSLKLVGEKKHK